MTKPYIQHSIILIPAYQPREALLDTTNKLISAGFNVVVVNDGSESKFETIFSKLDKKVHLLHHDSNKGKGASLKTGYKYIQKTFSNYVVITADADGQHHVTDIKKMAQEYQRYKRELLLGSRTFEDNSVPLRSRLGNVLTRNIFLLITKNKLSDTQTGLRAFDDSLIDFMITVPGERFEYEINVLLACSSAGITLVELPISTIYENNNESSHFSPVRDSWSIYKQFITFTSSSLAAFAIDYTLFIVLLQLTDSWVAATSIVFANVIARIVSASFNFTVNKHLIFKHRGSFTKGAVHYFLLAVAVLTINTLLLNILTSSLDIAPYIAKIATELTMFALSYFVQRNIIFAKKVSHQS